RRLPAGLSAAPGVEVSPSDRAEILARLREAGCDRGEVLFRMTGASDEETWIVGVTDGRVLTIPTDGSAGATHDRELAGHLARHTAQVRAWADRGPVRGLIVQFGGQTPLNLAHGLDLAGVPLLGTPLDAID